MGKIHSVLQGIKPMTVAKRCIRVVRWPYWRIWSCHGRICLVHHSALLQKAHQDFCPLSASWHWEVHDASWSPGKLSRAMRSRPRRLGRQRKCICFQSHGFKVPVLMNSWFEIYFILCLLLKEGWSWDVAQVVKHLPTSTRPRVPPTTLKNEGWGEKRSL
jgi:hypothetical protein